MAKPTTGTKVTLTEHDHLVRKHWNRQGVVEDARTLTIQVRDRHGILTPAQGPEEFYVRFIPDAAPRETKGLWLPAEMFRVEVG